MLADWDHSFPGCEPVAHLLRERCRSRWVRFHSLPESKRYPENEHEMRGVLERHNTILGDLLGTEREVILLTTAYSDDPLSAERSPHLVVLDPAGERWRAVPMHSIDDSFADPTYWHVSASLWNWQPGTFDPLVRQVAADDTGDVMMVDPHCRWLLHPYDGGMDVILESVVQRDSLKRAYPGWLSPREDGL